MSTQLPPKPHLDHQVLKRHRACTSCRQVKLRCDNTQTFPGACTRCRRNNLQCQIDPGFRRIRTKHRLNEVTHELAALQKKLAGKSNFENDQRSNETLENSLGNSEVPDATSEDRFYSVASTGDLPTPTPTLGAMKLEPGQVVALFEHYERHYHRHCPILITSLSVATLYHQHPFLFWTIVIISSRWHPSLAHLYGNIVDEYQRLLERTMMAPLNVIEPIQAGILLCFWPLQAEKQIYDPSWNYCGLVTNAAIKMGLHRVGGYRRENLTAAEIRVQAKTWLACCFVNYSHMWQTGVCILPDVPNTLISSFRPKTKSERDFIVKVSILRQYAKTTTILENLNENVDYSFIQYLCKDLNNLRQDYKESWNSEAEIILLGGELCIYTYQLEKCARRDVSTRSKSSIHEADTSSSILANIVFGIASRLITAFASTEAPLQPYVPKHYFQMLLVASTLILKISTVYPEAIVQTATLAQNLIRQTYEILSAWSTREGDEPSRAARLIETLSRAQKKQQLKLKEAHNALGSGITVLRDAIVTNKALRGEDENDRPIAREGEHDIGGEGRDIDINSNATQDPPSLEGVGIAEGTEVFYAMPFDNRIQDAFFDWNMPWDLDPAWSQGFGVNMEESIFM